MQFGWVKCEIIHALLQFHDRWIIFAEFLVLSTVIRPKRHANASAIQRGISKWKTLVHNRSTGEVFLLRNPRIVSRRDFDRYFGRVAMVSIREQILVILGLPQACVCLLY